MVTYHPLLKSLQSLINKHFNILRIDKEVKKVLKPSPVVKTQLLKKMTKNVLFYLSQASAHHSFFLIRVY